MLKSEIIEKILKEKIIVIVRGVDKKDLLPFAKAVYEGGVRVIELTYDAANPQKDEENAENIKMLVEYFGDKMLVGAGTVIRENQVELTKKAGGSFIISPDTNEKIIRKTCELDMVSIPGALTPTEIQTAHLAGADFVKLFPVSTFGPQYVKDVKAPLSHVRILAVGGVNEKNISDYLAAGAVGFGIGSNIVDKKRTVAADFEGITELAKNFLKSIQKTSEFIL